MTVPGATVRFGSRLFVWHGVAALAGAGATAVYADIAHRYESWKFDHQVSAPAAGAIGEADLRDGDPIGRLEIPRIGISVMVLHGTQEATLLAGAGHVLATPSPGGDGNVVIAAHRDTFFRRLEGIRPGDVIRITTVARVFEYVVDKTSTVDPEDTSVMESRGRPALTLITCYPFYFVGAAPRRFIVHATPAGS
jgi:LPXTG-site transpeptidase (sortase) family protein